MTRDVPWSTAFGVFGAVTLGGIALVLLRSDRSGSARVLLVAAAVGSLAADTAFVFARNVRVVGLVGAAASTALTLPTYEFGGIAFVMPAILFAVGATVQRWPSWLATCVRVALLLAFPLWIVSTIGLGALAVPVLLPLLLWSVATGGRGTRYFAAAAAGIVAAVGSTFAIFSLGLTGGWPLSLATGVALVAMATMLTLVLRRAHQT